MNFLNKIFVFFAEFFDFIFHIDKHIVTVMQNYGAWTFAILFIIIFCETGLVVTPFLPGDSLLFASGAVIARTDYSIFLLIVLLWVAAFLGDNLNYFIGRYLGKKIYAADSRFIKRKYIDSAQEFYERHGGKAVSIGRFAPIVRTFVPFVAGVGRMDYHRFVFFSFIGNVLWINCFCLAGYYFGNLELVKKNFSIVIIAVIVVSLIPSVAAVISEKRRTAKKQI